MPLNNKQLGDFGENAAAEFLRGKGYIVVETKFRRRSGEIDLICHNDGTTVFVEVKYRRSLAYGSPGEAVNFAKRKKIIKTALYYINEQRNGEWDFRFDVVEITGHGMDNLEINHIENAFY